MLYATDWETTYKGHKIRVENLGFQGEKPFIDNELQDLHSGISTSAQLQAKIKYGDGKGELVEAGLREGRSEKVECQLYINGAPIFACHFFVRISSRKRSISSSGSTDNSRFKISRHFSYCSNASERLPCLR